MKNYETKFIKKEKKNLIAQNPMPCFQYLWNKILEIEYNIQGFL